MAKITVNDIAVDYELTGTGARCVTLIHGSGDNRHTWSEIVPLLAPSYRVLTCDLRGHGATGAPSGDFRPQDWIDDLAALLHALGIDRTCLLGYSFGASVAMETYLQHRELVAGLVFANGSVGLVPPTEQAQREGAERRARTLATLEQGGMAAIFDDRVVSVFSPGFARANPAVVERYRQQFVLSDGAAYAKAMRAMAERPAQLELSRLFPPGQPPSLPPTLLIAGEYDAYFGLEVAAKTAEMLSGAILKIMPTGHASFIERPREFADLVLDFLKSAEQG